MARFDYFVVLAEMRTGSNFLESNLNALEGVACLGEAFNPHFIGYPDREEVLGVGLYERDTDPHRLLDRVKAHDGIAGFRLFGDHDPRVFDDCLADARCAKIVLTRNPVDSYVSWKIARQTGQWKLTNAAKARSGRVDFDAAEFEDYLGRIHGVQVKIMQALQRSGQTAFYVAYEDLQDVEVMNGLAAFLGVEARLDGLDRTLKKQNPEGMDQKVSDFPGMGAALARLDRFNLSRTPNFEPRRGPMVPNWIAAPVAPILYMPLKSGPVAAVERWMASFDRTGPEALRRSFSQNSLRDWMDSRPGHRRFTVLRHPVAWAHAAFCDRILATGPGSFLAIRETLQRLHGLELPDDPGDPGYDNAAHREAFGGFLRFVKANLAAQTGIRVDTAWGTQHGALQGMAEFAVPDLVLREDDLRSGLAMLAHQIGEKQMPAPPKDTDPHAARLAAIYDDGLEAQARDVYGRDYQLFGFEDWTPPA